MRLIHADIRNSIAVGVVLLLICLFGGRSMTKLPLQLFPAIDHPDITVVGDLVVVRGAERLSPGQKVKSAHKERLQRTPLCLLLKPPG